jgi:hypothetical protein
MGMRVPKHTHTAYEKHFSMCFTGFDLSPLEIFHETIRVYEQSATVALSRATPHRLWRRIGE